MPRVAAALLLALCTVTAARAQAAQAAAPPSTPSVAQPVADAPAAAPAPAVSIPLRVGEHAEYTRLVFDFATLTPYSIDKADTGVIVTFTSPGTIAIPAAAFHLVAAIRMTKPDEETIRVALDLEKGATVKDYRLNNKIVLDIYAAPKKVHTPRVAEVKTPKPAAKTVAKAEPKPEAKTQTAKAETPAPAPAPAPVPAEKTPPPAAKPVETAEATPPAPTPAPPATAPAVTAAGPAMPAVPVPGVIIDKVPPEQTAEAPQPEAEPSKISISTVEPTRLAVFTRFDTLWIVLDSEAAGAVEPSTSGPEAGILGSAKAVHLKGGTAYHYTLPPKRFVSIEKHSLTWDIYVSTVPKQTPSNHQVNVEYDEAAKAAKLMTELKEASNPLEIADPMTGDTIDVVATMDQMERVDQQRRFTNVEILPASIGMAVRPLADDVKMNRIENFVLITAPEGIIATPNAGPMQVVDDHSAEDDGTRLFDFPVWRQGGITRLYRNALVLENKVAATAKPTDRQDLLMKLALLYFANNFGQEALGVLNLIAQENEEIVKNPNFIALRGAASAMAGHYQDAIKDLQHPLLQRHPEVNLWIGYAAAASEQWRMANRSFPASNRLLLQYPDNIAVPFTIYMAESALRLGHTETANNLLASLDSMSSDLDRHYLAAVQYLKGEAARQAGNHEEAIRLWQPVAFGLDRLYHTKASLALANLRLQDKKITIKQAIDAVDSLRFAWRGDGLEVQILQNLGQLKVQNNQFLSGLEDMKTAAALADELLDDSGPIRDDMNHIFSELFVGGRVNKVEPLERVSIYTEFNSLMPQGADGAAATLTFADSLIDIDLLDKAEALLESQIKAGQVPQDKLADTGAKLATIYLLDNLPDKALTALQNTGSGGMKDDLKQERDLLKARALSQLNRTDEAIAVLAQVNSKEALHLKADVLWHAKQWDKAAAAIEELLPAPGKGLTEDDAQMVVNAAVAYKLARDPAGLAKTKDRYGAAMAATSLGTTFGVVTRSTGSSSLADRETLLKYTGEVDMFKGFLDTYKAGKGT